MDKITARGITQSNCNYEGYVNFTNNYFSYESYMSSFYVLVAKVLRLKIGRKAALKMLVKLATKYTMQKTLNYDSVSVGFKIPLFLSKSSSSNH